MGYFYMAVEKALGIHSVLDIGRMSTWGKARNELDCRPGFAKREDDTQHR